MVTLCESAYRRVLGDIRAGKFEAMGKLPSEMDLARTLKLGRQTIRAVLARLEREGWIVRRRGSGTYLALRGRRRFNRYGLIVHGSDYCEMFLPVARRISHLCQEHGVALLFGDISGSPTVQRIEEVKRLAREFVTTGVDGVIFQPVELVKRARDLNREIMSVFDKAGVPVVLLDSDIVEAPERSGYDLASVNHFDAGRTLAAHLRAAGAKRVAYLKQANRAPCVQERHLGVQTGCAGLALAGEALLSEPDDKVRIRRFLRERRPDAIACYNDRQASVLVKTLSALGYEVPRDLLVAGFDDVNFARLSTPALTTMHQPCEELAQLAFDMLQARLACPDAPAKETFLVAPLVVRASTVRVPSGNICH